MTSTHSLFRGIALAGLLALLLAAAMAAVPAAAASLRERVEVGTDIVTLGDLFDDAGALANWPVFRAPDPGVDGALPVDLALEAARKAGLTPEPVTFASIRVTRISAAVGPASLASLVAGETAARAGILADDVAVTFDAEPAAVAIDGVSDDPVTVTSFAYSQSSRRFRATVSLDVGETRRSLELTGTAIETAEAVVTLRPLARGTLVTADDVALRRVDVRRLRPGALATVDEVVGLQTRRPLRASDSIAPGDLELPQIVMRGELVTLIFEKPGLVLTGRGKALAAAAEGEIVPILNEQSRRTIEGIAIAPGKVRVIAPPSTAAVLQALATQ